MDGVCHSTRRLHTTPRRPGAGWWLAGLCTGGEGGHTDRRLLTGNTGRRKSKRHHPPVSWTFLEFTGELHILDPSRNWGRDHWRGIHRDCVFVLLFCANFPRSCFRLWHQSLPKFPLITTCKCGVGTDFNSGIVSFSRFFQPFMERLGAELASSNPVSHFSGQGQVILTCRECLLTRDYKIIVSLLIGRLGLFSLPVG